MTREVLDLGPSEFRFAPDEAGGVLSGYAAVWNVIVPRFNERVLPGAFTRSLAAHAARGSRPVMLYGHDQTQVVGVWTSVIEDQRGLKVEGRVLSETAKGPEARALLAAGGMNGLSIGFDDRAKAYDKSGVRQLSDLDLVEISLTPFPASPDARVTSFRSATALAVFTEAARRAAHSIRGTR